MKMRPRPCALDKVYKRRDRYEIPDWQREEVWDQRKKQQLIDSILKGWKLPKFYVLKVSDDEFEVVDGQQRLQAIYEFFANELPLSSESAQAFGGAYYRDLPSRMSDAFDDFEIEFEDIEDATDEEIKEFFQRLQEGLPLTSSEKLNAVHSRLRNFCKQTAAHPFFTEKVAVRDTRYAHFDIVVKAAAIEVEGLEAGLRFDELKELLESQSNFSTTSAVATRLKTALDFLHRAFPAGGENLKSRTIVQSLITLCCKLVGTGRSDGLESALKDFFEDFTRELSHQVELGQNATDSDYVVFQRSVNTNLKSGARARHEILLRKLLAKSPALAAAFDPTIIQESGTSGRIKQLGLSISELVDLANKVYSGKHGEDLFKATSKTVRTLTRIGQPVTDLAGYGQLIDDLYFLFREGPGPRLSGTWPSLTDINELRTDLRHDVDHGSKGKVRAKRKSQADTFAKYAGSGRPETIALSYFVLVQANLLTAVEGDLRGIVKLFA